MKSIKFELSQNQLAEVMASKPQLGKSSHIGNLAVKIVEMYFLSIDPHVIFDMGKDGADIEVTSQGQTISYEIKGTEDKSIAWNKLKVSSLASYNALMNGMELIRVTGVRSPNIELHFMKSGEDFTIVQEIRYAVKPTKRASPNQS